MTNTVHDEFTKLIKAIGIDTNDPMSICHRRPGERFASSRVKNAKQAVTTAEELATTACVWFSPNPIRPQAVVGRGTAYDVIRCAALYSDLDVKEAGAGSNEAIIDIAETVEAKIGQAHSAAVASGHGVHLYWRLDPDDPAWTLDSPEKRAAAQGVYRRWHRFVAGIAAEFGAKVDNVSDLCRVLRVPGSANRKDPDHPVQVTLLTTDPSAKPLTFDWVSTILDDHGIIDRDDDARMIGKLVQERADWKFGLATAPYVRRMVEGWRTDVPSGGRHAWLMCSAVRLQCAWRAGRINRDDYGVAEGILRSRFDDLASENFLRSEDPPGEVDSALDYAIKIVEAKVDEDVIAECSAKADSGTDETHWAGLNLPGWFWESRESLRRIRNYAWSRMVPQDVFLGCVLAEVSACLLPSVEVDTGIVAPTPLHYYAGLVGPVGGAKSSPMKLARGFIKVSQSLDSLGDLLENYLTPCGESIPYRVKISTGQGIAAAFIGDVTEPVPEGAAKGAKPKTHPAQIRTHVLAVASEGNDVVKSCQKGDNNIGDALREMWSGDDAGQHNAKIENRRRLDAGSYTLAVIVGFQEEVLADFLNPGEISKGTPQRFVFSYTLSPDMPAPADLPDEPPPIEVNLPAGRVQVCKGLRERIAAEHHAKQTGAVAVERMDGQKPAMLTRVAGLLAILDSRREISEEDWILAEAMWRVSRRICTKVVGDRKATARRAKRAERAEEAADQSELDAIKTLEHGPAAARIYNYVTAAGGRAQWTGTKGIRTRFNGKQREDADEALTELLEAGYVTRDSISRTEWVEVAS